MPPLSFSQFTGQFFWDFKCMDNVNYNFEIVEILYKAKKENNNDCRFNKPIIILLMAMIECMLYDFMIRIYTYTNDSFPNITPSIILYLRNKKLTDKLRVLIPRVQSQNLLCVPPSDPLYSDLEHLAKVRNRVHIQNINHLLDKLNKDEVYVFTDRELKRAERSFEKVCEVLCNTYPRWGNQPLSMTLFPRPW